MPVRSPRVVAVLLSFALVATACGGDDDAGEADGPVSRDVGVVYEPAALADGALNDAVRLALAAAEDQLGLVLHPFEADPTGSDRADLLAVLGTQGYGVVLGVGPAFGPAVAEVSPDHPDATFLVLDGVAPQLPNVVSLSFADEEAAYLAGAVAALVSTSRRIALVGGQDGDRWTRARAGFRAGAIRIDPQITIDEGLAPAAASGAVDAAQVQAVAAGLMAAGADVVHAVPGPATGGALGASAQLGGTARVIGADLDRAELVDPGLAPLVLGSVVKDLEGVLLAALRAYVGGGLAAGTRVHGVAAGAIAFTGELPPDQRSRLDELTEAMAAGEISVPRVP